MSDAHLGDLVSALLDGELVGSEADLARAHIAACPICQAELQHVGAARDALRSLPHLDPPPDFLDRVVHAVASQYIVRRAIRRRWAAANVALSVAASVALLVVGVGGARPLSHAPAVSEVGRSHEAVMSVLDASSSRPRNLAEGAGTEGRERIGGEELLAPERLAAPFDAEPRLGGGYELVAVLEGELGVHLLYASGRRGLSVFQQPGRVDWDALPDAGERTEIGGRPAWAASTPVGEVIVMEHDDLVQVVVGEGGERAVLAAAEDLPGARSLSLVQRLRRSCEGVLEDFSLLGAA